MKLGFEVSERQYDSGSQQARVWTERWVADWRYCPNCGATCLKQFTANNPVADFFCASCSDQFEVKSKNASSFGRSVVDGAYERKIERLESRTNPNLILLGYSKADRKVRSVFVVPKHFFVTDIIQKRKPLASTARRAGWIGSNILLSKVPESGRIFIVRDGLQEAKDVVLAKWRQTLFLRTASSEARGWLIDVMKAVDAIGNREFTLEDVYAFEPRLRAAYPNNNNIRPKIRQQLQVLRDNGYLEFRGRGLYRLRAGAS